MHRLWENWENRHSNHLLWGLFAPTSWMRRAEPGTFSTGVVLTFPGWWREELCRSPGPKLFPWGHPGQWLKGVAGRPTLPGLHSGQSFNFPCPRALSALSERASVTDTVAGVALPSSSCGPASGAHFDAILPEPQMRKALSPFSLPGLQGLASVWSQEPHSGCHQNPVCHQYY